MLGGQQDWLAIKADRGARFAGNQSWQAIKAFMPEKLADRPAMLAVRTASLAGQEDWQVDNRGWQVGQQLAGPPAPLPCQRVAGGTASHWRAGE
jgi:hypothetical protein